MYTLGINAAYHDSAACLVHDGRVIAAVEEERLTHIKHAKRPIPFSTYELPFHAIHYCLQAAGIALTDVHHIAYSYDPYLLLNRQQQDTTLVLPLEPSAHEVLPGWESVWEPLFVSSMINTPRHLAGGAPHHLQALFRGYRADGPTRWHFVEHHLAHAASAFLPSPFESAAILTLDGRGERATTSYSIGEGNMITRLAQVDMPHSLGLLYEDVTGYLGFLHSSDEYKVMALASFGQPRYLNDFREIIQVNDDGQYTIADVQLDKLFGPPRRKGEPFEQRHYDIAHSLQLTLEEAALKLVNWFYKTTRIDRLCLAGGVALNCVANTVLSREGPFEEVWVQPAAGDAGTALGAAMWIDAQQRPDAARSFRMEHAYWGPDYNDEEIARFLDWTKTPYRRMQDVAGETADLLAQDKIIGWFQGRMEFGPRALGSRSILASPISPEMQARLNEVKDREDFRPVAPVVIEEDAPEWFEQAGYSPFMLFVYKVKDDKRDKIPAVCHVDGTARIQTVNRRQHERYYDLLQAFKKRTGVPVLINTSFNTLGKPIVCTPRDALECFWSSPFDALVIGSFLIEKKR